MSLLDCGTSAVCLFLLPALAAATAASAQTAPNTAKPEIPRFLVYFDEFSANLSDEAKGDIADAAKRARDPAPRRSSSRRARALPASRKPTNISRRRAARSSPISSRRTASRAAMIRQEPIGQTGSSDPSVYNRRVDIILER